MCAFLVVRKPDAGIDPVKIERALTVVTELGFTQVTHIDVGHTLIWLCAGLAAEPMAFRSFESGDFIYASGTFFFKDEYAPPALESFYKAFDEDVSLLEETHGSFIVLLYRSGRLHILTEPLGLSTVFFDDKSTIMSSSFLVFSALMDHLSVSVQNVYEYVFCGSVLGQGTIFKEVEILPMNARLVLDGAGAKISRSPARIPEPRPLSRQAFLDESLERLRRHFKRLASAFGDRMICALSGGYDSRLILALLQEQGVSPQVFVYGRAGDEDVVLAKQIASGENIPLDHIDKSTDAIIPPEEYSKQLRRNLLQSDGYTWGGLFSGESEHRERRRRAQGGRLYLNGGGGEVFRNFFYLPNRRFSIRQVMSAFYAPFDPKWCTALFREERYFAGLEGKVETLLGRHAAPPCPSVGAWFRRLCYGSSSSLVLERHEVEWLYPTFRCRSWVAREIQLANWHGHQINPFLDHDIYHLTTMIPVGMKDLGAFEAELIRRVSPRIAAYPSAYGHDFCRPPSRSYRFKYFLSCARGPALRRLSFRIRQRLHGAAPLVPETYTTPPYVKAVFGDGAFEMAKLFHLDRIRDAAHWNRILTVEYLARVVGRGAVLEAGDFGRGTV